MGKFDIEEEIEKTLNSLDNHKRVEASPFFYTKLQQQLKAADEDRRSKFSIWNNLQSVLIVIFVFANVFTIIKITNTNQSQSVNSLASDYSINVSKQPVQDYIFNLE
jgi:hypothetical protein